jgi:predicted transcriptional regulator
MQTTDTASGIDFAKVETLRRHMLLSVADMAKVLGVSRVTYYHWVKGGAIRPANLKKLKGTLKQLLVLVTEKKWPTPEITVMDQPHRLQHLLELLGQ